MDPNLALLALVLEHTSRPAVLAKTLLADVDPRVTSERADWRPGARAWQRAEQTMRALALLGIDVVPVWTWPPRLARVKPLAPALFVRGSAALLARRAVAIVGARRASPGPLAWAAVCAEEAARLGWLVVSGGALGIDGAAHRSAIGARAPTLVYLGVPADRVYPRAHRRLFESVLEGGGALVSEHPPLAPTFAVDHARRNRLIAAHAEHVFVAEAAERSGSLGTVTAARRLGVPVWVPPTTVEGERGGIEPLVAAGVGAPATTAAEVLEGIAARGAAMGPVRASGDPQAVAAAGPDALKLGASTGRIAQG